MPGLIPEELIAEVRERTDIVQVIGQHVQLKRAGINYKGLCPFHDEKTPSFNVNSQRQFYHCFGCHESGDVIRFLMKIEGRSFTEVVEDLAARAGIEIPQQRLDQEQQRAALRRRSERQRGLDLNAKVAQLYRSLLQGAEGGPGRRYLEQRGISEGVAAAFQLGYAPPAGDVIVRLLQASTLPLDFAVQLGLVAQRGPREAHRDRFWNRLIFPIIGPGGEILGFGGRLLGDGDGPKYVNTPETALYHKGELLYGLHAAAKAIRREGRALVVEGNFDVLQLHQHGFENAVAPMGTALTERQVLLLSRFADQAVAIFDGDDAGQAAALKAVTTFIEGGVSAKIATLPRGQDPDSFLRQSGAEAMARLLERALPAIEFMVETLRGRMEDTLPGRARLLERLAPLVARLRSATERELYVGRLAVDLGLEPAVVQRVVAGQRSTMPQRSAAAQAAAQVAARAAAQAPAAGAEPSVDVPQTELDVLGLLVEHPHLVTRAEEAGLVSLLTNDGLRVTYRAGMQMQQASGQIDPAKLLEATPSEIRGAVAQVVMSGAYAALADPTRAFDDCVKGLRRRRLAEERQAIYQQMAKARSEGNAESERALARRIIEVEREIHETR